MGLILPVRQVAGNRSRKAEAPPYELFGTLTSLEEHGVQTHERLLV
jgi:hypothetical protein